MAEWTRRAGQALAATVGSLLLAGCLAVPALVTTPPAHPTAVAACTDAMGAGWQVAVKVDREAGSTLALTSGDSIATCQTWANAERTDYVVTVTGVGLHPTPSQPALSYLTGGESGGNTIFLVGRVPPSASAVRVHLADGSQQEAVLGGDLWLAWLEQPGEPTGIEALDASGAVITEIVDPDGIHPTG